MQSKPAAESRAHDPKRGDYAKSKTSTDNSVSVACIDRALGLAVECEWEKGGGPTNIKPRLAPLAAFSFDTLILTHSQNAHAPTPPTRKPHITSQHSKDELHDTPIDLVGKTCWVLTRSPQRADDLQQRPCFALNHTTHGDTTLLLAQPLPRACALAAADHLHQTVHEYWERVLEASPQPWFPRQEEYDMPPSC